MIKRILFVTLVILYVTLTCYAKHDVEVDGLFYNVSFENFTAAVVGREPSNINVVIPNKISINGRDFTVKVIERHAFDESDLSQSIPKSKRLQSVTIGDSIQIIGGSAFKNCENIKRLCIGNNIKEVEEWILFNSSIDYLEIINNSISKPDDGRRPFYKVIFKGSVLSGIKNVGTFYINSPIFQIKAAESLTDFIGGGKGKLEIVNLVVSGNGNIEKDTSIIVDYNHSNSSISEGYGHLKIKNLILTADNKKLPEINAEIENIFVFFSDPLQIDDYKINKEVYLNAVLYVPDNSFEFYLNNPQWRRFLNIKKLSEADGLLSPIVKSKLNNTN
ncbi:MAG: leucine-rich repeat domain-containing protein [Muribaculaceae bacterium]|nr:leucine-rich repeat domain-containing protein [Muribaculaceae bacterium]